MNTHLPAISTTFERESLVTFLDQFDQNVFNSEIDVKSWTENNVPQKIGKSLTDYLLPEGGSIEREELFRRSKQLREEALDLDVIGISVPSELSELMVNKMEDFVNEGREKKVLLDLRYEKELIAGAVVESNGYILEHSMRSYFENRKGDGYGF